VNVGHVRETVISRAPHYLIGEAVSPVHERNLLLRVLCVLCG
jgi:hypothetical protein